MQKKRCEYKTAKGLNTNGLNGPWPEQRSPMKYTRVTPKVNLRKKTVDLVSDQVV